MSEKIKRKTYRVIDVNLNRAQEGLRVCEEIFRFVLSDKNLSTQFKNIRHKISKIIDYIPVKRSTLLVSRDIKGDIGKQSTFLELRRDGLEDIFFANIQRSKESVRVLEEFCKLLDKKNTIKIKSLRYEIYNAEKKAAEKFKTLHNSRQGCLRR